MVNNMWYGGTPIYNIYLLLLKSIALLPNPPFPSQISRRKVTYRMGEPSRQPPTTPRPPVEAFVAALSPSRSLGRRAPTVKEYLSVAPAKKLITPLKPKKFLWGQYDS